jgi:hypothetical protein
MSQLNFEQLLERITIVKKEDVTQEELMKLRKNPDAALWLNKIGFVTRRNYEGQLIHFLKCVHIDNPSHLLDLKMDENPRRRFFPAERLAETWAALASQKIPDQEPLTESVIKNTLDAVRSFFKHNKVPLIQVNYAYKPKPKDTFDEEQLRQFRESFTFYGKIIFDFLLSVPLRDGQFQICPNCGRDFNPRWQHILTYPKIEPYSPFVIRPAKGHENKNYSSGLMQVSFLTPTAAFQLNLYREIKEKALDRKRSPENEHSHWLHSLNTYTNKHSTNNNQR